MSVFEIVHRDEDIRADIKNIGDKCPQTPEYVTPGGVVFIIIVSRPFTIEALFGNWSHWACGRPGELILWGYGWRNGDLPDTLPAWIDISTIGDGVIEDIIRQVLHWQLARGGWRWTVSSTIVVLTASCLYNWGDALKATCILILSNLHQSLQHSDSDCN